ncbi:MAG TPA: MFS transporter, partial [Stellaceae bacterium]|nr:MFS transporter [Stellaceae bacterium]
MTTSGMPASGTATIDEVLEARGIGGAQVFIAILCGFAVLFDGISTQVIGYVAPQIARSLHLGHEQLAHAFGAGLFGLLIGGLSCSFLADFAGRRTMLLISTLIFGIFTIATAYAGSLQELIAWRFVAGLGLGGAMPTAIALTAEVSPHRTRATMVMMMFCGFPLGGAVAGVLAVAVLPAFGWQGVFLTSGVLALALLPILYVLLPESPVFLVNRRADPAKIAQVVGRIAPDAAHLTIVPPHGDEARGAPIAALFREGRAAGTVLL